MIINRNTFNQNRFSSSQNFGASSVTKYLAHIKECDLLPHEEVVRLVEQMRAGNKEARQTMVSGHEPLVHKIVDRYLYWGTLQREDLVQEGMLGLLEAIKRFDTKRGCHFVTYATWWIRARISTALKNTARTIRIPVYMLDDTARLIKAEKKFTATQGKVPTDEELAQLTGFKPENIKVMKESKRLTPDSLDAPMGKRDDETFSLHRKVEDDSDDANPLKVFEKKELNAKIHELLSKLSEKQREAVMMRLGFTGEEEMSFESIGTERGCSHQAARDTFNNGMKNIRHLSRRSGLQEFWT